MHFALVTLLLLGADPLKGYEPRKLSSLGKTAFTIEGTIMLPPKVKSATSRESAPVGEQTPETLATIELPDGVKLELMERNSKIAKKTDQLEAYMKKQGELVINSKHPTGYFIAAQRKDGVVMMGANWSVEPGLDCATEAATTLAQVKVIEAICASFKPAK
jgi:hypothetical protein